MCAIWLCGVVWSFGVGKRRVTLSVGLGGGSEAGAICFVPFCRIVLWLEDFGDMILAVGWFSNGCCRFMRLAGEFIIMSCLVVVQHNSWWSSCFIKRSSQESCSCWACIIGLLWSRS